MILKDALDEMIAKEDLILGEDAIFLPPFYYAECGVANKLRRLLDTQMGNIFDNATVVPEDVGKQAQIEYDAVQLSAIRKAIGSKVMVLTGGPGTGKTTTTLGIIAAFESLGQRILLAAPTGRAAMLQRNLIYTGITRAKKICIIIGTTKALAYSIHNMVVLKHNTRLKERLNGQSSS